MILCKAKAINRDDGWARRSSYNNGDWVYGLVTKLHHEEYDLPAEMTDTIGISGIEVDYTTICRYTELDDKNGTKIFEGDIVKIHTPSGIQNRKVVFSHGCFHCGFDRDLTNTERPCLLDDKNIEVVGNVYDNPELL